MTRATRGPAIAIACLPVLLLVAGCAPGPLAASTETATPSAAASPPAPTEPASSATPSPSGAAPTERPDSAEWQELAVDDWLTLTTPAGWQVEPRLTSDSPGDLAITDETGYERITVFFDERDRVFDVPACTPSQIPFRVISDTERAEALPAEGLAQSTAIYEFDDYDSSGALSGKLYELRTHLHEPDRVTGDDCAPASGVYPGSGGYLVVSAHFGTDGAGLRFPDWEAAEAFAATEAFQTVETVIGSARITL
ncbi:hypothetical protein [Agrococcus citreus]|uniref:Lipoprotein n=1 Tax=Agrococcus citreus TaxID=84643 RepID=A0ABN1YSW5_9MICO